MDVVQIRCWCRDGCFRVLDQNPMPGGISHKCHTTSIQTDGFSWAVNFLPRENWLTALLYSTAVRRKYWPATGRGNPALGNTACGEFDSAQAQKFKTHNSILWGAAEEIKGAFLGEDNGVGGSQEGYNDFTHKCQNAYTKKGADHSRVAPVVRLVPRRKKKKKDKVWKTSGFFFFG